MKSLFKRIFGPTKKTEPTVSYAPRNTDMMRRTLMENMAECRKRARDYRESDPFLAGKNEGRAEIMQAMLETLYK